MASTLTPEQIELYLQRIHYADTASASGSTRLQHLQQCVPKEPLATVAELQKRHLGNIPWGNSALHYSQHRSISLHPSCLFEKLVIRRLDGYCLENTNLLYLVLRAVGYQVYPTGGRVCLAVIGGTGYSQLSHMVLIVTIDGQKYMVDVGFGTGNSPTAPLPLQENTTAVCTAPSEMRLIKDSIPELVDKSQKLWIYQIRYNAESDCIPIYSFSEVELLPQDFDMISFFTSQHPTSWFTQDFVCTKMIPDERGIELRGAYIMWGKEVKRRLDGQTEVVATLNTEEDRVEALAKWFGLHFHEHEVQGIKGLGSWIK